MHKNEQNRTTDSRNSNEARASMVLQVGVTFQELVVQVHDNFDSRGVKTAWSGHTKSYQACNTHSGPRQF